MAGDLPEDADDEPGWKVGLRVVEFGRELYPHVSSSGDEGGCDAFAQSAQSLADHFGVQRPRRH